MKTLARAFAAMAAFATPTCAATIQLSFAGTVDGSGASLNGRDADEGDPFTLDIGIDDTAAATGRYAIESISYTLPFGAYTTVSDWAVDLFATQVGPSIELTADPLHSRPGERFHLDIISGFGPSSFDAPLTWGGSSPLMGDFYVGGFDGPSGANQLSGRDNYQGTLVLTVIPEPSSLVLGALGALGLLLRRRPASR